MNSQLKSKFLSAFLIGLILVSGWGFQVAWGQEDQDVQQQIAELRNTVEKLEGQIPKIGYLNRQEAFSVFPQVVEEERQKVSELESEMEELNKKAEQREIEESKYKRQRDLLQAKHLKARIGVDMAILETMIQAGGFSEVREKLEGLKEQAKPMNENIDGLIEDINNYSVSPQQVSETLDKIGNQQFKQLDDILTNLAQLKITQITQDIAEENDYGLVVEREENIIYRQKGLIHDLTPEVKKRLKEELNPE